MNVGIKPLEWHGEPEWCFADTPVGHYTICRRANPHCYRVDSHGRDRMESFDAPNVDAAKAAAQADFDKRILAWLISDQVASPPVDSDSLKARIAQLEVALRAMLDCPDIADNDFKDEETHAAERIARAALSSQGGAAAMTGDLVERLRGAARIRDLLEAADEIASLRTALATEREAREKAEKERGAAVTRARIAENDAELWQIQAEGKQAAESSLAEAKRLLKRDQELLADLTNGDRAFQERQSSQHLWARCVEAEAEDRRFLSQEAER